MTDNQPEQSTFFAISEDEEERQLKSAFSKATGPEIHEKPLFFADSEDENDGLEISFPHFPSMQHDLKKDTLMDIDDDIEIPLLRESPAASTSSASIPRSSSPAFSIKSDDPPSKRRRLSSTSEFPCIDSKPMYVGSIIVSNAWSTTRGTGYVKPGDEINIERDEQVEIANAKLPQKRSKHKPATKQLSISAMLKPQAAKPAKKKQDYVVRLTNKRGFGNYPT